MRTTTIRTSILISMLISIGSLAVLACEEPSVIAPLPSPNSPDLDRIFSSALVLETETDSPEDGSVAVVGLDGAVSEDGQVEFLNRRTGRMRVFETAESGSFSALISAQPADVLELVLIAEDGRRSAPTQLTVAGVVRQGLAAGAGGGEASEAAEPPAFAGIPSDVDPDGGGATATPTDSCDPAADDCQNADAGQDDKWTNAGQPTDAKTATSEYAAGEVRVSAGAGFTSALATVFLSNHTTGAVLAVQADNTGAFVAILSAIPGDVIHMFAQDPNTGQTGALIWFVVE